MSKDSRRRPTFSARTIVLWLAVGGALVIGGLLIGRLLNTGENRQAISRLSTGDFHSLAFSPTQLETVFFGHHGGLMVSQDGGRSWRAAALQNADAMALAISAADPTIMYAAGHAVLLKSTDQGASWQPITHDLPGTDIHGFTVNPDQAATVYAHVVGQLGIFRSDDGGETWAALPAAMPASTFNLAVGPTAQILYATAGQAGLWRSADGGQNWSQVPGVPGEGAIAVAYNRANHRLYVTTLGNSAGLYASNDNGATWQTLKLSGKLMAIASSPLNPNRLMAVDDQGWVYASGDAGATWLNKP
jgi:photosystem II stability/assembly factor-like uncharacterized protein